MNKENLEVLNAIADEINALSKNAIYNFENNKNVYTRKPNKYEITHYFMDKLRPLKDAGEITSKQYKTLVGQFKSYIKNKSDTSRECSIRSILNFMCKNGYHYIMKDTAQYSLTHIPYIKSQITVKFPGVVKCTAIEIRIDKGDIENE